MGYKWGEVDPKEARSSLHHLRTISLFSSHFLPIFFPLSSHFLPIFPPIFFPFSSESWLHAHSHLTKRLNSSVSSAAGSNVMDWESAIGIKSKNSCSSANQPYRSRKRLPKQPFSDGFCTTPRLFASLKVPRFVLLGSEKQVLWK